MPRDWLAEKDVHDLKQRTQEYESLPQLSRSLSGDLYYLCANPHFLVTGDKSNRRQARVWNRDGIPSSPVIQHDAPVISARIVGNDTLLATCTEAGQFRLWHIATGQPVTVSRQIPHARMRAISPDGRILVTHPTEDYRFDGPKKSPCLFFNFLKESSLEWEQIEQLAHVVSGRRINQERMPVPIPREEISRIWQTFKASRFQ
jgi:WD40 repeat protein